jgi:hypothetical protein
MTSDEFGDIEQLDENLRKWFKEKWVRFGPDGKIRGACARGSDKEGKPKCLPQSKAHSIGKKGRKYAGAKKRREDPNPERSGKAKNVATKKKSNEDIQVNEKWSEKYKDSINCSNPKGFSQKAHCAGKKKNEDMNENIPFNECPKCRGPIVHESMMTEKQDACYHKVKSRYKVWPSAYASGALVQCRKKGASNWGTGGKKNESSIMKGLVNEEEYVLTLYIDGKPSAKYGIDQEAKKEMERLKAKFPNRQFELKREIRGGIGGNEKLDEDIQEFINTAKDKFLRLKDALSDEWAQSKEMWKIVQKGKSANPKEINFANNQFKDILKMVGLAGWYTLPIPGNTLLILATEKILNKMGMSILPDKIKNQVLNFKPNISEISKNNEGVIIGHDKDDPQVAVLGGAGSYKLSNLKKKALGEAKQLAQDIANGEYKNSAYNVKQLANTLNTIVAAEEEMEKLYFGEDYTGEFAAEVTPAINPYGGLKDRKHRGMIGETPTDNPTGASGEGGLRKYRPKPAGEIEEDTAYAGGMGQGGNAGQSYRKFKPKSAGTFKEDELDEACWDTHRQVGMKNKGGRQVPNCVPKESAIMRGLKR